MPIRTDHMMLDPLFRDSRMTQLFGDLAQLEAMLDFEAALAQAAAECGVIPVSAASAIGAACREAYEVDTLARDAAAAGNVAIPLIRQLTARVRAADPDAARWVHWGATSQDVLDTAVVLQLRRALQYLDELLAHLIESLVATVRQHRSSTMPGRTWLQHAVPVTFGLKVAGWLDALLRHRARLDEMRARVLVLQFGGAAGTLESLGGHATNVARTLGARLHLPVPDLPWHSHRDRIVEAGAVAGLLAGTLAKMGRDIALLAQTEVGEVSESTDAGEVMRGGSSAMPQKRNPVGCAVAIAAGVRVPALVATLYAAMPQEHERSLGLWPVEWETLPDIYILTAGSLGTMNAVITGLEVHPARMRSNLELQGGLIYSERVAVALASVMGKEAAHELVGNAARTAVSEGRPLRAVLGENQRVTAILSGQQLDELFDANAGVGFANDMIEAVLSRAAEQQRRRGAANG